MPGPRDPNVARDVAYEFIRAHAFALDKRRVRLSYSTFSMPGRRHREKPQTREHRRTVVGILDVYEDESMARLVGEETTDWVALRIDDEFMTYLDDTCDLQEADPYD